MDLVLAERLGELDPWSPEGIQAFNLLIFGTPLHDGQLRFAMKADKEFNHLSPGNSWGKTEYIARDCLRWAWYKLVLGEANSNGHRQKLDPRDRAMMEWWRLDWRGLVASLDYKTAKESYARIQKKWDAGGPIRDLLVARPQDSEPGKLILINTAEVDFGSLKLGGQLVEATRRQKIWVDETGHMPDFSTAYDDVLLPRTLGVSGVIDGFGTPKEKTDQWLFEVATEGLEENNPSFYAQEGSSFENQFWPSGDRVRIMRNPRMFDQRLWKELPPEKLTDVKATETYMTPKGRQVVLGAFLGAGGRYFNRARILQMFRGSHEFYVPTGHCVTAWDLAGNRKKSDATVGITLDLTKRPYLVSRFEYLPGGTMDWAGKYDIIEESYREDQPHIVGIDVTGPTGDSIQEELESRGIPIEPIHFGGSTGKKLNLLRNLASYMEMAVDEPMMDADGKPLVDAHGDPVTEPVKGLIRFPDAREHPELLSPKREFDLYQLDDVKLKQDVVMTLAMDAWLVHEFAAPEPYFGRSY